MRRTDSSVATSRPMQKDAHVALQWGDPRIGGLYLRQAGATNSQYSAVILMVHCNRLRLHGGVIVLNGR